MWLPKWAVPPLGALRGKGQQGALEVGLSERVVGLFTIEVT
jgi:hypothetical protein